MDVATAANFGFFGFQSRIANDGANSEEVYLRQHKSSIPDAMQYTPVLNTGRNWQVYNVPGFHRRRIPKGVWFHLRQEVVGRRQCLYVKDMDKPTLVMNDLKSGVQKGKVALYVLAGETIFRSPGQPRCALWWVNSSQDLATTLMLDLMGIPALQKGRRSNYRVPTQARPSGALPVDILCKTRPVGNIHLYDSVVLHRTYKSMKAIGKDEQR